MHMYYFPVMYVRYNKTHCGSINIFIYTFIKHLIHNNITIATMNTVGRSDTHKMIKSVSDETQYMYMYVN